MRSPIAATYALLIVFLACAAATAEETGANVRADLLRRVFGNIVVLSSERLEQVRQLPRGEKLPVDIDGDGRTDEVWFIDDDARHNHKVQPLLVRAIDEDGDMQADHPEPDRDSDLYIVDWNADGQVDVALDYHDTDGDDDVDEMGMFFYSPRDRFLGGPALRVWWARDDGDDNRLWHTINYTYSQRQCQWLCDFSGDETFVAFGLVPGATHWKPVWENPFLFYDPDGDGASEIVIRYQGVGDEVEALRYSFDIDDNADAQRRHDYDFSISAVTLSRRWFPDVDVAVKRLRLAPATLETTLIRDIPTEGFIRRDQAQSWAIAAPWYRTLLTWDEIGSNTNGDWNAEPQERWEGVIAHASANFPQIGGPSGGVFNKRNEVATHPPAKLELYWDAADARLHLVGAAEGWILIDYDNDGRPDIRCDYLDTDGDGFFDQRRIDLDHDGRAEFTWQMQGGRGEVVDIEWPAIKDFYVPRLAAAVADAQHFLAATAVLLPPDEPADPVEQAFRSTHALWPGAPAVAKQIATTPAGRRFYLELMCHRRLARFKTMFGEGPLWAEAETHYAAGRLRAAAEILTLP